jgi:hypothetical protein
VRLSNCKVVLRGLFLEENVLGESSPKSRKTLVSMITLGGVVAEIAIMAFGRPLLKRFDKDWLLLIALCSSFLRILSYALVPDKHDYIWFILAVEIFIRGVGTGCLQIAAVDRANELAGPLLKNTAQGIQTHKYTNSRSLFIFV